MDKAKRQFAQLIRPLIAKLAIQRLIPERIGKYRILDCLAAWEDGDGIHSK